MGAIIVYPRMVDDADKVKPTTPFAYNALTAMEEVVKALRTLVYLKTLKVESEKFPRDNAQRRALIHEYESQKDAAWAKANEALNRFDGF